MILVLSGEGPTDLGSCTNSLGQCCGDDLAIGPLTVLIDQIITRLQGRSVLANRDRLYYVSESKLRERAKALPGRLKPARSKKREAETGYFFGNAVALGVIAKELETETGQNAIAVLHRDCDSTRSGQAGMWKIKHNSMLDGFKFTRFSQGVPMLPKPTSEVWWLCAAQQQSYQHCSQLEDLPGNQASLNHPKKKLEQVFGGHKTAAELCEWLDENPFDFDRAESMPSFKAFEVELERVVNELIH